MTIFRKLTEMLWIQFFILISSSTLVVWWLYPIGQAYVYLVVGGLGILIYYLEQFKNMPHVPSISLSTANNVIDLNEFRRRKQEQAKEHQQPSKIQWVPIFEAPYVIEADLVASMLESHGIVTQILNRHHASILIHPMNESIVKILVSKEDAPCAIQLIQRQHHEISSPDPSGKSSA